MKFQSPIILVLLLSAMENVILLLVAVKLKCKLVARAPGPDRYNVSRSFTKINPVKSYSIGLPHNEDKLAKKNSIIPGPTTYSVSYKSQESSCAISMKERYKYFGNLSQDIRFCI